MSPCLAKSKVVRLRRTRRGGRVGGNLSETHLRAVRNRWRLARRNFFCAGGCAVGAMVRLYDFSRFVLLLKSYGKCGWRPSPGSDFGQFSPAFCQNTIVRDPAPRDFAHFFFEKKWAMSHVGLSDFCMRHVTTFLCIATLLTSCALPSNTDLLVSSLRCSPSAFDSFRTNTEIRYTLAKPATVSIHIARRDASGQLVLVNTLARNIYETKGSHGHTWLGDTVAGVFAESGLYIAILEIENTRYETTVRIFHF